MTGRALLALAISLSQIAQAHSPQELKARPQSVKSEFAVLPLVGFVDIGKILAEARRKNQATRTDLFDRTFTQTEINACIESVCGSAAGNYGAFDVMESRKVESENFKQLWADLGPRIADSVRMEFAQEKAYGERLSQAIARGMVLSEEEKIMPSVLLAFHNVLTRLQPVAQNLLTIDRNTYRIGLNETAFAKFAGALPPHEQRIFRRTILEVMTPGILDSVLEKGLGIDPITLRLKRLYDGREPKAALIADAQAAVETYKIGLRHFGNVIMQSLVKPDQLAIIARVSSGLPLNVTEGPLYAQALRGLDMVSFMNGAEQIADLRAFNIDPVTEFERQRTSLADRIAKRALLSRDSENTATMKCRPRLNVSLARNASDFKLRRTRAMIEDVRSAAKVVMANFVSPATLPSVQKVIDAIAVEIPQTEEDRLALIVANIDQISVEVNQTLKLFSDDSAAADAGLLLDLMTDEVPDPTILETKSRALKICEALPVESATDAAIPPLGRVHLSWYAANFESVGIGIFSHEFGHVMSYVARALPNAENTKYYQSLSCTVNRHPYVVEPIAISASNPKSQTSEEDWADYFSTLVIRELQKRGNARAGVSTNMGCALVNDAGNEYKNNTTKTAEGDNHSSGFMRLLLIAADRGDVTEQCRPFLAYAPANNRPLNCEAAGAP